MRVLLVLIAWCLAASRPAAAHEAFAAHPAQLDSAKATLDVTTFVGATHRPAARPPLIATLVAPFSLTAPARRPQPVAHDAIGVHTASIIVTPSARGPPG